MNTTELIEIARECCSYPVKVSDYHWCREGEFIFTEAGLNAFAQRIEAPHLQRIAELEQAYYTFTEQDLREFASRIRSSALFDASWIVESNAHDWEESIRQIDAEASAK